MYEEIFDKLSRSKFRSRFCLKAADISYIRQKGRETIFRHAKDFIAKINEITTREEAMALKGSLLVSKDDLPELEEGDFYDDEVLGFAVKNLQDEVLGEACGITDNGAQDLLAVRTADGEVFYIPMVEAYLSMIDFEKRLIIVDWSLDWN